MYLADEFCGWAETTTNDQGTSISLCHHPLMNGFCDYCDFEANTFDYAECPYWQPTWEEPSQAEEEVRQYLEYTEPRPPVSAVDQAGRILKRYQKKKE